MMSQRTKTGAWALGALLCIMGTMIALHFILQFSFCVSIPPDQRTSIMTSQSPEGTYQLEAIRTDWSAQPGTSSISVYTVEPKTRLLIYDALRESECTIDWLTDSIVVINGVTLDLSKGERHV